MAFKPTYTKPELSGHKILYAGKRFYIFEVSEQFPYEGCESHCEMVIFDKSDAIYNGVVAWCRRTPSGSLECETPFGQGVYPFSAESFMELIKSYISVEKQIHRWNV